MRIKHWQGYGTVEAKRIPDKSCTLHIRVIGNHEYGINCGEWDEYRLYYWLIKRFDRKVAPYSEWRLTADRVHIEEGSTIVNGLDTDTCDYYFYY